MNPLTKELQRIQKAAQQAAENDPEAAEAWKFIEELAEKLDDKLDEQ